MNYDMEPFLQEPQLALGETVTVLERRYRRGGPPFEAIGETMIQRVTDCFVFTREGKFTRGKGKGKGQGRWCEQRLIRPHLVERLFLCHRARTIDWQAVSNDEIKQILAITDAAEARAKEEDTP